MTDYSQHLNATDALLQQILGTAKLGDTAKVVELAQGLDWEAVASEFESVAGRYRSAVYRHGRRIIRNLRRPYMLYHDCVTLDLQIDMLRGAIEDSPSLLSTAGEALEKAYQSVLLREVLRGHKYPDAPAVLPWPTIEALIAAAEEKLRQGRILEDARPPAYTEGRRVRLQLRR